MALRLGSVCALALVFAAGAALAAEQFETRLSSSPTLMPRVHHPNNGAAIYVFALPDN
jgi:hypothetical protein